ncbi:hypothetical protein GCM10009753_45350 [Streptantibioticus ferralitis]
MRKMGMKSVAVSTIVSAAAAASLLAAGPASAAASDNGSPREGMVFSSLLECQTYGNTWAQMGGLTSYTCTPWGSGYQFNWS